MTDDSIETVDLKAVLPPCVHATCDDPEWCAGEPECKYDDSNH